MAWTTVAMEAVTVVWNFHIQLVKFTLLVSLVCVKRLRLLIKFSTDTQLFLWPYLAVSVGCIKNKSLVSRNELKFSF